MKRILTTFSLTLILMSLSAQPKIVGGDAADIANYPYQVSWQTSWGEHGCGGSIINEKWVITAAHCVGSSLNVGSNVYAGVSSLEDLSGQRRDVIKVIKHPQYNDNTFNNDIALLEVDEPFEFNDKVQPIPLITQDEEANGAIDPGVTAIISGWGSTQDFTLDPNLLRFIEIPIVSNQLANQVYGTITSAMLAAGLEEGGKDSCQGDSGGPLAVNHNGTIKLAGIVSFGTGCALPNYYGIYARVPYFEDWIAQYVQFETKPIANFEAKASYFAGQTSFKNTSFNASQYTWSLSGPVTATSTSEDFSFNFTVEGDYILTLTASEADESHSISKEFSILTTGACDHLFDFKNEQFEEFLINGKNVASTDFEAEFGVDYSGFGAIRIDSVAFELKSLDTKNNIDIFVYITSPAGTSSYYFEDKDLSVGTNYFVPESPIFLNDRFTLGIGTNTNNEFTMATYESDLTDFKGYYGYYDQVHYESTSLSRNVVPAISFYGCVSKLITNVDDNILESISIFPNPTNGIITISGIETEASFKVNNQMGQLVQSGNLKNGQIDITSLNKGLYLIQLKVDDKVLVKKILKQ